VTDLSTSTPAAGWYPDPAAAGGERWWTGIGWTADVRALPVAVTQPTIPPPTITPPAPIPPTIPALAAPFAEQQPYRPFGEQQPYRPFAEQQPYRPFGEQQQPYRPFSTASPGVATPAWRRGPQPNAAATRAIIAAAVVVAFVGGSLVLNVPVGVPFIAIGLAIIFGIIGAVQSKEKLTGLKRSVAAIAIGALGLIVTIGTVVSILSYDFTAELERSIETTLVEQDLPVAVTSVDCPQMNEPPVGSTLDCTVMFADSQAFVVTVTILDANGTYQLELAT
jgi:hypothetical protein